MRVGRRLFFVFVTAAVLVGAASTVVAAATVNAADSGPRALAAACPAGSKRAVIGGKVKCLRAGQKCATRYQAAYKRYGFMCVSGHLRKRPVAPPPPPPPPPPPAPPPPPPAQPGHHKGPPPQPAPLEFHLNAGCTPVLSLPPGQTHAGCTPPPHPSRRNLPD